MENMNLININLISSSDIITIPILVSVLLFLVSKSIVQVMMLLSLHDIHKEGGQGKQRIHIGSKVIQGQRYWKGQAGCEIHREGSGEGW